MADAVSQRSYLKVACVWVICFSAATVWESVARVLIDHQSWDLIQVLQFIGWNWGFAVACSLILAFAHRLLLTIGGRFCQKLLLPEIGVAAVTFLAMAIWVVRYRFRITGASTLINSGFLIFIFVLIYLLCMALARLLWRQRVLVKGSMFAIVLPVIAVILIQPVRIHPQEGSKRSPVDYVLLISVDTLRKDFVSAYDATYIHTPVIDQIAKEGALFVNALSLMPETGPSHMSMLTGLSPLEHGVLKNGYVLPGKFETLPAILRKAGFLTAGFVSGYPLQVINSHLDRGFQQYDDHFSWVDCIDGTYCGRFFADRGFVSRYFSRGCKDTTDSVLKWLERNSQSPFFLFIHYYDPHIPYDGELINSRGDPTLISKDDLPHQKQLYGLEVRNVDAQIDRVINFLKQKGIYNRTLLIFTADHGESLGEHQEYYSHQGLHEAVIRVPLIVRYPAKIQAGLVIPDQVALVNIFKTILNATGLKSAQAPNSRDLVELANGRTDQQAPVVISSRFLRNHIRYSVRTNEWKLIRTDGIQRTYELYHLTDDPNELVNVYSKQQAVAKSLEAILMREHGFGTIKSIPGLSDEQVENLKALGYVN